MTRFFHGAATSTGRVRQVNEDSYLAAPPIFAVADGMGGHDAGEVASAVAIDVLARYARGGPLSVDAVLAALDEANRAVIGRDEAHRMGTTVTGLASLVTPAGSQVMVFNVGDSRVYRLAGDQFGQLTVDHSEVQELVLSGAITPEQARIHPRRNIVTRALGSDFVVRPDHWLLPPLAGDRYLVCSDGLTGELTDEEILPLLLAGDPQQAAAALVAAADEAGGHDNTTVIVVDVDRLTPAMRAPPAAPASRGPRLRDAWRLSGQGFLLRRRLAGQAAGPPDPPAQVQVQGRHEHRADHDRVEQHPERHREAQLGQERDRQRAEHRERAGQHAARRGDHAAGRGQAGQRAGAGSVPQRFFAHPRHQEDVVVDAERDQEDEHEQRERRVGAAEVEHVIEEERADPRAPRRTRAPRSR